MAHDAKGVSLSFWEPNSAAGLLLLLLLPPMNAKVVLVVFFFLVVHCSFLFFHGHIVMRSTFTPRLLVTQMKFLKKKNH